MAVTAWGRQGTPGRALWEATDYLQHVSVVSPFLLKCAEVSLFLCLYGNDMYDCVRQSQVCVTVGCLGKEEEFRIMGKSLKGN